MSRLASLLFAGAATLSLIGGCASEDESSREAFAQGDNNLDMDGCVKIEGADIGVNGITVTLGGNVVEFTSWITKDGEAGEFVGFTLSGSAVFFIKAGNNADALFEGSGTSWVNPNGTSGSAAKGISNIQICEITPPPPPPPEECGSDANPCPPPPPPEECGSDANPCPPPPPPEECGSDANPCPPPPPPEECGSESNPCPPPPHEPPCD